MDNDEKILQKLVEIDEKVTTIGVQTTELMEFKDYTVNILDKHTAILERLDQERIFTIDRIKRLEEDVEKIKLELKIA